MLLRMKSALVVPLLNFHRSQFVQIKDSLIRLLSTASATSSLPSGDGSVRRLYRKVDIQPNLEKTGFNILLDTRILRTPKNAPLRVPSYPLALAIGAEWEWQSEKKVHPITMPLMTLAATAVDQPKPRVFMIEELETYVFTDPVVSRDKTPKLRTQQDRVFYPLQSWAESFFGVEFNVSDDIKGTDQSQAAIGRVRHYLSSLDPWRLVAIHSMVLDCKSLIIGAGLFNGRINVKEAVSASRVEEDYQTEEWGVVEGGHDIEVSSLHMRLTAASLFFKLLKVE